MMQGTDTSLEFAVEITARQGREDLPNMPTGDQTTGVPEVREQTPKRSRENKLSGNVVEPTPETKKLKIKSSNEKVKASNALARIAG